MLRLFNMDVDIAPEGREGLHMYQQAKQQKAPYDVVIMDLTIPGGMGGREAMKELMAIDPEAKVIVSSGYSKDPILAQFHEYGFAGRLAKPFQIADLEQTLLQVLHPESKKT